MLAGRQLNREHLGQRLHPHFHLRRQHRAREEDPADGFVANDYGMFAVTVHVRNDAGERLVQKVQPTLPPCEGVRQIGGCD